MLKTSRRLVTFITITIALSLALGIILTGLTKTAQSS